MILPTWILIVNVIPRALVFDSGRVACHGREVALIKCCSCYSRSYVGEDDETALMMSSIRGQRCIIMFIYFFPPHYFDDSILNCTFSSLCELSFLIFLYFEEKCAFMLVLTNSILHVSLFQIV